MVSKKRFKIPKERLEKGFLCQEVKSFKKKINKLELEEEVKEY